MTSADSWTLQVNLPQPPIGDHQHPWIWMDQTCVCASVCLSVARWRCSPLGPWPVSNINLINHLVGLGDCTSTPISSSWWVLSSSSFVSLFLFYIHFLVVVVVVWFASSVPCSVRMLCAVYVDGDFHHFPSGGNFRCTDRKISSTPILKNPSSATTTTTTAAAAAASD